MADDHYAQSLVEHLERYKLRRIAAPYDVPATYVHARTLLHSGRLELPDNRQLMRDLREVSSAPTAGGRVSIRLPRRPGGGHADLVSALVLALYQRGGDVVAGPPAPDWSAIEDRDEAMVLERRRAARIETWHSDEGLNGIH
jgi:hypothetical protein